MTFRLLAAVALVAGAVSAIACSPSPDGARDRIDDDTGADVLDARDADPLADGSGAPATDNVDLVDVRIGTGGRGWWAGNAFVGASLPFGLVQLGPDTRRSDGQELPWQHCAGYHANDDVVRAFSHTHLHGTGIPDLGTIGVMPRAGDFDPAWLSATTGYASRFDPSGLAAAPGYLSVPLVDANVAAELTVTQRAAAHRYTTPAETLTVVMDVAHTLVSGRVMDGSVRVLPERGEVELSAFSENQFSQVYGGYWTHLVIRFSEPWTDAGTWSSDRVAGPEVQQAGHRVGAWVSVDAESPVTITVGVSYVDIDGARANLDAEIPGVPDFDAIRADARRTWSDHLASVSFEGGTDAQRAIMATSLYHAMLMPTLLSDADARYPGFDGVAHTVDRGRHYTNHSLWDTYRFLHPLLILIRPREQRDMVESLVRMADQGGGYLPRWPLGPGYSTIMIGTPADIVIAETWLKGIRDFDAERALEHMVRGATEVPGEGIVYNGREGVEQYTALGWVPADVEREAVSWTLEVAIADAAIAALAADLGHTDIAATFARQAGNYRNVWDPASRFFRGRRADGTWLDPFDPLDTEFGTGRSFTEGNAWQYRWLAPHDVDGLIELFGGPEAVVTELTTFFEEGADEWSSLDFGRADDIYYMLEPQHWYWHGNEPDIHASMLFALAGRPDLTRHWVRWILDEVYGADPEGIPGNDDAGTLGAWYVFAAAGLMPMPGTTGYVLAWPLFERVTFALDGATLVVEAPDAGAGVPDEVSIRWNGTPVTGSWIEHATIAEGGTLTFEAVR